MRILSSTRPFIICFLLIATDVIAQTRNFEWAKGTNGFFYSSKITNDSMGNTYGTGDFYGTVDLNPGQGVNNHTSKSAFHDVYITKYTSNGDLIWSKSIHSNNIKVSTTDIITDNNSLYLAGDFDGTVDFDPGPGVQSFSSTSAYAQFILKLDTAGNFDWVKIFDGAMDKGDLNIDGKGNVFYTGRFSGTVDFDPGPTTQNQSATGNNINAFIVKLDNDGNYLWSKVIQGDQSEGSAIAVDPSDNIYFCGEYSGSIDINTNTSSTQNVTSIGQSDIFIVKLDSNGLFIRGNDFGGVSYDRLEDAVCDLNNNLIITGSFFSTIDIDFTQNIFPLQSKGLEDIFIVKYNENGILQWGHSFGTSAASEEGRSVAVDRNGSVYIIADIKSTLDIDPGAGTFIITASNPDVMVAVYSNTGRFEWGGSISGTNGSELAYDISLDGRDNLYLSGQLQLSADVDPTTSVFNLTATGSKPVFLVKIDQCLTNFSSITEFACVSYTSPSGEIYTNSGLFMDTIPNIKGCDSIITIDLTILPGIDTSVTVNGTTLKANLSGGTYQWLDCDNGKTPISGESNQTFTPTSNGNYAVEVSDGICTQISSCYSISSVDVKVKYLLPKTQIFPNPATDILFIKTEDTSPLKVEIINMLGMTVLVSTTENPIVLNLSPGTYILKITDKVGNSTNQVLIVE